MDPRRLRLHARPTTVRGHERPCGRCGEWKDLEEFPIYNGKPSGRSAYCKPCKKAYNAEYKRGLRDMGKLPVMSYDERERLMEELMSAPPPPNCLTGEECRRRRERLKVPLAKLAVWGAVKDEHLYAFERGCYEFGDLTRARLDKALATAEETQFGGRP